MSLFGQGNLTNFCVSISHLCWVCKHQKFCRVSFETILKHKKFHAAPFLDLLRAFHNYFERIKKVENLDQLGFRLLGIQKCQHFLFRFWATIMDLLITLKYWISLFPISYQEEFQLVKHYLSRFSISKNIKLKSCKIQFFRFYGWFFFSFALSTYGTLKMFLFSVQNSFYIILSSYVVGRVKKKFESKCLRLVSRPPKSERLFGKITAEQVLKYFQQK